MTGIADRVADHLTGFSMTASDRLVFTLTIIGSLIGTMVGVTSLWRGQRKDRAERKAAEKERILAEEENRRVMARFVAEFAANGGSTMRDAIDRLEKAFTAGQRANEASHAAITRRLLEQVEIAQEAHAQINRRIDAEAERIARIYDLLARDAGGDHVELDQTPDT